MQVQRCLPFKINILKLLSSALSSPKPEASADVGQKLKAICIAINLYHPSLEVPAPFS
jgi:hypothetical protein